MEHYAGIDVSLESASLCVVDATGRIVREAKVASEPEILIGWFRDLGLAVTRIGLEAGPLSQWLYAGMRDAGLTVELLETRHVRDAFKAMPVKTDRKDARGIAQLMRLGWFRPVHCKSLPAQEVRALLTARKLLQTKNHDVEMCLRGVLRGSGLKVGKTTPRNFAARIRELVAGHATLLGGCRGRARGAWHSFRAMAEAGEAPAIPRTRRSPRPAADDRTRRRYDRRADLRLGNRRSRPLQILQDGRRAFRADPQEISIGRDQRDRPHLQDRRRRRAYRALRGRQRHPDPAGEGLYPEKLGDAPGRSRRHAQSQGRARPQARRGAASHARRWNELPRRQSGCGRNPLRKGDRRFGRSRHQPPGARSRRRDDGSGQAACYTAAPYGRPRAFRLADLLLIRPHQVAARRRPRTEEKLRRQDQGSEGLTNRGP